MKNSPTISLTDIFEFLVPKAFDSIKVGNLTINNIPDHGIGYDLPVTQWNMPEIRRDLEVILHERQAEFMSFMNKIQSRPRRPHQIDIHSD